MKKIIRALSVLLALGLLFAAFGTGFAHEALDWGKTGSLVVEMAYNGDPVTSGTLTAYRVGEIHEENGNFSFQKTEAMESFSGSFEDVGSAALAEDIAAFVKTQKLPAYAKVENQDGAVVFSDLELGLYLIVQTKASTGFEPLKPFLVSVPMYEDGRYVYEVNAAGKFQLHQKPQPTTPTKPPDPTLPQTGQLNWPVPVLTVLGLCLFSIGWVLRFGRKRNGYEK